MEIGEWYTTPYSGRKQTFDVIIHIAFDIISVHEYSHDKKTGQFERAQKDVTIDKAFYEQKIKKGELVKLKDEDVKKYSGLISTDH